MGRVAARPSLSNYGRLLRGETDPLVDPGFLLGYFGADPAPKDKYRLFVEEAMYKLKSLPNASSTDALLGLPGPESRQPVPNKLIISFAVPCTF